MDREHDDHRVNAGVMLRATARAAARPAAADHFARLSAGRTKAMAPMPVAEAQRRCEGRRVALVELRKHGERCAPIDRRVRRKRRKARLAVIKPEEQRRIADFAPLDPSIAINGGKAFEPFQFTRGRVVGERRDPLGLGAKRISAVEPGAGEKNVRRQGRRPVVQGRVRPPGDTGLEAPPRRCGRAAATSHRHSVRRRRRRSGRARNG